MKPVLFVVTELERPVGGLHRFATEFAQTWARESRDAGLQLLGLRDLLSPLAPDLHPAQEYSAFRHKVYEASRAGSRALFIEPTVEAGDAERTQEELWIDYGISSIKDSSWDYYRALCSFWKAVPEFVDYSQKELGAEYSVVDCQDWLAFPAGFMTRKKNGLPLHCRFHSTEMGRAMGKPDLSGAPFTIETAALLEADFLQGVSVSEAKFLLYHYLPHARQLRSALAATKPASWGTRVDEKLEDYQDFLISEPKDMVLFSDHAAGFPNGIILDEWRKVTHKDIARGRELLEAVLPNKKRYVLFVGRTEARKGIGQLIDAFSMLDDDSVGLVLVSSFTPDSQRRYEDSIAARGLSGRVAIHSGWVSGEDKAALFCACDVMVFPSLYEPFGLVCLEGLAADLACRNNGAEGPIVVASATGGLGEIIRTGVNGFKVPMEEFDLQPELLLRVLRMALRNRDAPHPVSIEGAHRVQDSQFDWATIIRLALNSYSLAIKNMSFGGKVMEPAEAFGVNAGKIWLCLKGNGALSVAEIKSKSQLSTEDAAAALGWLGRENKIYVQESGRTRKYGLRE